MRSGIEKTLSFLKGAIPRRFFSFLQPAYHFLLAWVGALFYCFPSRHLMVVGVTGTKGKTTTVHLLHEVLASSGAKVASLSSLRFKIGDVAIKNKLKMTMPGRFFVQKFLSDAKKAGCAYAVIEVTSEGIRQFRHRFINFDIAVMTNVAPEHIEAHGSFEKYLRAKLDLFWRLPHEGLAVISRDDPLAPRFSATTGAHRLFYGTERIEFGKNIWHIRDMTVGEKGISFSLGGQEFTSSLVGAFNAINILAAVAVGLSQHFSLENIASAIARVSGIPGRMEFMQREPFTVVIDYAHTPDSLREVYRFLKGSGRPLICVLSSAGGGRDKWKRPELGKIAAEFCNRIILTNEDPYDEDPRQIVSEIKLGIIGDKQQATKEVIDRREAIRLALQSAEEGDTVVITGKGAELWMMGPKGEKTPWDERGVIKEELQKLSQ